MTQLNPNQYKRIGSGSKTYGQSDGWYYDETNSLAVLVVADTVRLKIPITQTAATALLSDGTDSELTAISGDVTVTGAGVTAIGSSKVLSAMLSPLLVKYSVTTVTSAQLLAINATPKTLVAAASGYIHVIHRAVLVLNYNSAAYADNGILGIYETNATGTLLTGTLTLASFLAQTADTIKELHPLAHSATTGLTRADNKAIVLTQATGESISGDSPVDVHLWYSTIPHGL